MRGLAGERARQLHQAQLARRQLAGEAVRIVGEADAGHGVGGKAARLGVRGGAHVGADDDVVGDRHARERPHDLEGAADAGRAQLVRLAPRDVAAVEHDLAGIRAAGSRSAG